MNEHRDTLPRIHDFVFHGGPVFHSCRVSWNFQGLVGILWNTLASSVHALVEGEPENIEAFASSIETLVLDTSSSWEITAFKFQQGSPTGDFVSLEVLTPSEAHSTCPFLFDHICECTANEETTVNVCGSE